MTGEAIRELRELLMRAASDALDEPDAVRELRDDLIRERTKIDALIALFDKTLERVNGATPAHVVDAPPAKPTRRLVLLKAMAENSETWDSTDMRQVVIDAGLLTPDERGAKHFYNLTNQLKKRNEIIHVDQGRYRISPIGYEIAKKAGA